MSMQLKGSNAYVAACSLPPEILSEVLLLLRAIWQPKRERINYVSNARFTLGWMMVLQVCAAWRRVALSTPMLWQEVNAANIHPNLAREFLARSADLGLRISFDPYDSQSKHISASRDVLLNADVFRRLEALNIVCGEGGALSKLPHELLEHEAPKIRELIIHNQYWSSHFKVTPNMLGTAFPHLRRLSLRSCSIPLGSFLFTPTLTHLQLSHANLDRTDTSSWVEQILSYVSQLSALEYFSLSFYALEIENIIPTQKVSLPLLRHVVLVLPWNHVDSCTTLLGHLSIPPTANLIADVSGNTCDDQSVYLQLLNAVSINNFSGEVQLGVNLSGFEQWHVYRWDPLGKSRVYGRHIDVSSYPKGDQGVPSRLAELMNSALPQFLTIGPDFWESLDYTDQLGTPTREGVSRACDVRSLTVCYCGCEHLRAMLSDQPPMFPLLETIVLTGVYWVWGDINDDGGEVFVEMKPTLHECPADANALPDLLSELLQVVKTCTSVKEIRVEGVLGEWWNGWEHAGIEGLTVRCVS